MKTKLWITGSQGQLGQSLLKYLDPNTYDIYCTDQLDGDITQSKTVNNLFYKYNFDTVINCAAFTAVDRAESEPDAAAAIHVQGVRNIVNACHHFGTKLIHISTDFIFDHEAQIPIVESDCPNPKSVYGQTKWEGEQIVLGAAIAAVVIRTSWLFSEFGHNFVKTMLYLGQSKTEITVVNDQMGTPTYASDLANVCVKMLPKLKVIKKPEVFHFCNTNPCSWYDFAETIMQLADLNCKVKSIPSSAYPTLAQRPAYSVLNTTKIENYLGIKNRSWQEALQECLIHLLP